MSESKGKPPLQTIRTGGLSVNLWEQRDQDGKAFVTVNISKIYKDKEGNFRNGGSFGEKDLETLKTVIVNVQEELQKWKDYYRETGQARETDPPKNKQLDMAAKRDEVMREAAQAKENGQSHIPENAPKKTFDRVR